MTSIRTMRDDPYVNCRRGADGHTWDRLPFAKRTSFGQPRDYRCPECTTIKHQIIDANGNLAAQWYEYPDDFKLPFAYDATDVRLESIRRGLAEERTKAKAFKARSRSNTKLRSVS
jgi:hypothetical protein